MFLLVVLPCGLFPFGSVPSQLVLDDIGWEFASFPSTVTMSLGHVPYIL